MPEDLTPRTIDKTTRTDKINVQVDSEISNVLKDIDIVASDLDCLMEVLKDRMIQSTDASFPIALARLGELRMDTIKKKIDIIKTLVHDKSIETAARKKSHQSDLESILSGAALGAALGAKITGGNLYSNVTETIIDITPEPSPDNTIEQSIDSMIEKAKDTD